MAATAPWRRGGALARLGAALLLAALLTAGCATQQEASLSALHYFNRGNAAYQAEDYRRAIEHFNKALEFDDQAPDIYYNLGLAYYRAGDYEDAVTAYQHAIGLDPSFADAELNLALAYDKLYKAELAHNAYNRYRSLAAGRKIVEAAGPPLPSGDGGGQTSGMQRVGKAAAQDGQAQAAAQEGQGQPARAQARPAQPQAQGLPAGNGAAGAPQQLSNPFEGNAKWWTQDAASPRQ